MAYGQPDVYYQPEAFGLVPVAEIDYSDGCYQFDLRVVWKHVETGQLYTGRDSGCSCPSPFEDFIRLDDLEPLDLNALRAELETELSCEWSHTVPMEAAHLLRQVVSALA